MTIRIKKRFAGSYFVVEQSRIEITKTNEGNWVTSGMGLEDVSKTKRDAVEYAAWIYNHTK